MAFSCQELGSRSKPSRAYANIRVRGVHAVYPHKGRADSQARNGPFGYDDEASRPGCWNRSAHIFLMSGSREIPLSPLEAPEISWSKSVSSSAGKLAGGRDLEAVSCLFWDAPVWVSKYMLWDKNSIEDRKVFVIKVMGRVVGWNGRFEYKKSCFRWYCRKNRIETERGAF